MICCSCGKEIDINYGREYWNGIYCKKCADEMLSPPEYIKTYKRIIADLQAENAALRERLGKWAVDNEIVMNPRVKGEQTYYVISRKERRIVTHYICTELTSEAAEARLAELKGEKKNG